MLAIGGLDAGVMEELEDGGLIVRGVPILAAGTWRDSVKQTDLEYTVPVLRKFATNWHQNALWTHHAMPTQRKITDKIGEIINPRFDESMRAVVGDLHFHGHTFASREAIGLVKHGDVDGISAEHIGAEVMKEGKLIAESIMYLGGALVERGACKTCVIPSQAASRLNSAAVGDNMTGKEKDPTIEESVKMLSESFDKRIGAVETKLKEEPEMVTTEQFRQLSDTVKGTVDTVAEMKDMETKLTEMTDTVRQLSEKLVASEKEIKMLKDLPQFHTEHGGDNPFADDKDSEYRALSSIEIDASGTISKARR